MHVCHKVQDCEKLMNTGFNNRHVGATLMNKDSSRLNVSLFLNKVKIFLDHILFLQYMLKHYLKMEQSEWAS